MNTLFTMINSLPEDIINYIKEFMPKTYFVFTNKSDYTLYHYIIRNKINNYENYVRFIIKRDCYFVFDTIIRENYQKWQKFTAVFYKNITYKNYLYFIINFCIENDSVYCYKVLNNFIEEQGLCKNLHKKNMLKYIKWKT